MPYSFSEENIKQISSVLGVEPTISEGSWMWQMNHPATRQSQTLAIHQAVEFPGAGTGVLVVVQTKHGYFELHDCNAHMIFEPDEVLFISSSEQKLSTLVVGRQCTCSMFSPINREILNADFSTLDPAILMSAMQLSLTEDILP